MDNKKNWGWRKDTKWYNLITEEANKHKYPCPKCGRKKIIAYKMDRTICDYCGTTIYKDKQTEFRERLQRKLKKVKEKENGEM